MEMDDAVLGENTPLVVNDGLLTVHDVARTLNVPVSWVYEHVRRGSRQRLPAIKLGKYLRFTAADVRAFVTEVRLSRR
jgi:excisionase family DNA binding protein